jgi:hypothetical protein
MHASLSGFRPIKDSFENHSVKSLKQELSIDTTVNPPLFSLENTFNVIIKHQWLYLKATVVVKITKF